MEAKTVNSTEQNVENFVQSDKTVLIVEDDRSHRTLMDKILQFCAFKTVQAENGFVALSKIDSGEHFDLVILDWDMPELDGLETAKAIRMREVKEDKPHMPVIAFTANRKPGDKEKCLAAGMDAYLPKDVFLPKWRETLIDNLQGLIAGSFELQDFEDSEQPQGDVTSRQFDLEDFDVELFEQTALLLKDELPIALEEYFEDAAAYIRSIESGIKEHDVTKIIRGSHPLKSNSKGFGLMAVSNIAEAINTGCEQADHDDAALQIAQSLIAQLKQAFSLGEDSIKHELRLRS